MASHSFAPLFARWFVPSPSAARRAVRRAVAAAPPAITAERSSAAADFSDTEPSILWRDSEAPAGSAAPARAARPATMPEC